jgi:hypothetical protein
VENRHLIAYLLILAVAAFLAWAWRHATREKRAARRLQRLHEERRAARAEAE